MSRICVVRQLYYPRDPLVRREVEALVASGHQVDVVCMRRKGEAALERAGAVTIRRLPLSHRRGGLASYIFEYAAFLVMATVVIGALHLRRRYALVQVNTPPDSLVFAAILPKLLGTPVLLHLQEPMPEFFASKFKTSLDHPAARILGLIERASIAFADRAITCTEQMRLAFASRGADPARTDVILNASDEELFDHRRLPQLPAPPDQFVLITHGTMEERYGIDTTIQAVGLLRDKFPGLRLMLFGEGSFRPKLVRLAAELGVGDRVSFSEGWVPYEELLRALAGADAGVVAMKRDPFRDITHCHKMFDFVAMRKPAIVSRTAAVEAYFGADCFEMFESDDAHDLARAIRRLVEDRARGALLAGRAAERGQPYRWPHQRERYLAIVAALLRGRGVAHTTLTEGSAAAQ